MTFHYSQPFESLLEKAEHRDLVTRSRAVIVGSGYGGSVAALRLVQGVNASDTFPHRVIVLERGKEYALGEFPTGLDDLPGFVGMRSSSDTDDGVTQDALFDVRRGEKVDVVVGSGLGGTSLINANVAIEPDISSFAEDPWPRYFRTQEGRVSLQTAFTAVRQWLDVPRQPDASVRRLNKYRALERLAQALELDIEPAPINVALTARTNYAGVPQNACTNCGNCVTGCNVGAKSTLAMNLIPAAHASGAKFFTGALVYSVQRMPQTESRGAHWRVYVKPTSHLTRARFPERYYIEADIVILAAGTLGSTEILKRSEQLGLEPSPELGKHFSTNGDGVAASFCEADPVNAVGSTDFLQPPQQTGPTITACARPRAGGTKFLLEDGAIPAPLTEIIGEVVTSAAQFGRLGYNRLPAWLAQRRDQFDPLAVHREAQEHGQVFLMMCNDGARGTLSFEGKATQERPEHGTLVPCWDADSPSLTAVTDCLSLQDRKQGLNNGQFVANPAWRLLPESASSVMDGAFPGNRLITVHPLGGCRMADSEAGGVVDHDGRVFWRGKNEVYPGLYVLDGAILPGALGENPFLTIAALAWRACDALVKETVKPRLRLLPLAAPDTAPRAPVPADAQIVIREQLIGALPLDLDEAIKQQLYARFPGSADWFERDRLVLRLETNPASTETALRGGSVKVSARLYLSPIRGDEARRWKTYGISSARLGLDEHGQPGPDDPTNPIAVGQGMMTIMEPEPPAEDEVRHRRQLAFDAYKERRSRSFWQKVFWEGLRLIPIIGDERADKGWFQWYRNARGFASIAEMQSTYRTFTYRLDLETKQKDGKPGKPIQVRGQKRLAWGESRRLWTAFTQLDAKFTFDGIELPPAKLYVDMDYLVDDGLLRVAAGSNVPRAIFNCVAYVARLARAALQSEFWEFGAPDYPKKKIEPDHDLPKNIAGAKRRDISFPVPCSRTDATPIALELHRYGESGPLGPVLLLHGLAQGSLIFAHERFETSMAQYLIERGYDVWLLDYRLSPQLAKGELDPGTWSIDDIARFDIPVAIKKVLDNYPGKRLHIFAHCVGAAATSMAILRGDVGARDIASFALNAIHPWIMPSPYNLVRAKVGAAFGDHIDAKYLDPIIQTESTVDAQQTLLDRIGFSVARFPEREGAAHDAAHASLADSICDRMTFMYGRMWRHANVRRIHGAWQDLVGKAPAAVYRHLFYMLGRERIVDCQGGDAYISRKRLPNWAGIRTLFLHGEESEVFNPQSATRSAIRLSQALQSTPIRLRRIVDFGHMDPILAEQAPRESYRYLDHFFQGRFDHSDHYTTPEDEHLSMDRIDPTDDPAAASLAKVHCGPVLRGIRVADNKYVLRYWLELPTGQVEIVKPEQYLPKGFGKVVEVPRPPSIPERYVWVDAEYDSSKLPPAAAAAVERLGKRSTGALNDCHFIVASCCYPGTPFDRERTDEAYTGINAVLDDNKNASDALFLIGDQIYADSTAGLLDPYSWRDRYEERYWSAFNAPRAQRALVRIPTHFAIDDHEVANDYSGVDPQAPAAAMRDPNVRRFAQMQSGRIDDDQLKFARGAALQYMGSPWQGPAAPARDPQAMWYALGVDDLACPAFVMDTRSERERQDGSQPARMIGDDQLAAVKAWLSRVGPSTRPKFIFTGSVIAPLTRDAHAAGMWMSEDGLVAYRAQLDEIVACIVDQQIQGVVFVAGDLHLSCVAKLTLRDTRDLAPRPAVEAWQIVSSGLYAPLPFANTALEDIAWGEQASIPLARCAIEYVPESFGEQTPRFLRVSITPLNAGWRVAVAPYDALGRLCGRIISKDPGDASAPVDPPVFA